MIEPEGILASAREKLIREEALKEARKEIFHAIRNTIEMHGEIVRILGLIKHRRVQYTDNSQEPPVSVNLSQDLKVKGDPEKYTIIVDGLGATSVWRKVYGQREFYHSVSDNPDFLNGLASAAKLVSEELSKAKKID